MKVTTALGILVASSWPFELTAQVCEPGSPQDNLQYLRRLSLDLRGRVPSFDELYTLANSNAIDQTLIDQMLESPDFVARMRGIHRDLLWTNVTDTRVAGNVWRLRGPSNRGQYPSAAYYISANGRANRYRGDQVPCLDEPATFDSNTGEILTTPEPGNPNIRREGWVEVSPYWAPETTIKVCAFDAQETLTARDEQGRAVDCSAATSSRGCGCGPNLRFCESGPDETRLTLLESMNEQLFRFVDTLITQNRPYTDILKAKDMEVNGPISHWLRHQALTGAGDGLIARREQNYTVPELDFAAVDTWQEVQRGERHSGVLTMPGYLVKFQSDRGRANRFYNAFLCQHFEAVSALPPATDACHLEADLTKRCGCKDCHIAVEPAAAYWGRWGEAGLMPLNEDFFPKLNTCCIAGGACTNEQRRIYNTNFCNRFYYTERDLTGPGDPTASYVGTLRAYVFADAVREASIETGPEGIADSAIASGAFAQCTVKRMWKQFMAREPRADEDQTIAELTESFKTNYNLKTLIKELVTRPEYIQAGRFSEVD